MGDISRRRLIMLDAAAAAGFVLLPQLAPLRQALGDQVSGSSVWLSAAVTALPLAVRRLWPLPVFVWVLLTAFLSLASGLGPTAFLAAAYALYPVAVTWKRNPGRSVLVVGGTSVAGVAVMAMTGTQQHRGGSPVAQVVLGLLALGATWAVGAAVGERRESARRAVEEAAERAKAEERLRIARDIHDVVTHSVGLIAVKAGIANHVVESRPEEAREALTVIEEVSRKALSDMRATLKVLRRTPELGDQHLRPVRGLSDLPALVATAEAAGVRVDLRSEGIEEPPDGVALAAFRIVQEALTNVVKHAAPTRCRVRVVAADGVLTVEVADDGPASARRPSLPGGGMGILGMRERAAAHGGTLTAGPGPDGGFRVAATLPY